MFDRTSLREPLTWGLIFFACLTGGTVATSHAGSLWPTSLEPLEKQMDNGSPESRREAARRLVELPPERVSMLVERYMQDGDSEVRNILARAALEFDYRNVAPLGAEWVKSSQPSERRVGIGLLSLDYSRDRVRLIGQLVTDHELEVRLAAIRALGSAPAEWAEEASNLVLTALGDGEPEARSEAARAVGLLGVVTAAIPLAGHLQDQDDGVRAEVARALGAIGSVSAVPGLLVNLADESAQVVAASARALGYCGNSQAVMGLVDVISRFPFGEPQLQALVALAHLDRERFQLALQELSRRSDARPMVLAWAGREAPHRPVDLGRCLSESSLDELEFCAQLHILFGGAATELLRSTSDHRLSLPRLFTLLAAQSRLEVGAEEVDVYYRALELVSLADYQGPAFSETRRAAFSYLDSFEQLPASALDPLLGALHRGPGSSQRLVALLELLSKVDAAVDPSELQVYLQATDPLIRAATARRLAHANQPPDGLSALLSHPEPEVIEAAAQTLARGMSKAQAEVMLSQEKVLFRAPDSPVRLAMLGVRSGLSSRARRAIVELWQITWPSDRSWLMPASVHGLHLEELVAVVRSATSAERTQFAQLLVLRPDASQLAEELTKDDDDRVVGLALETLGWVVDSVNVDTFIGAAKGRPAHVRAAALRGLRRAYARGRVSAGDLDVLLPADCWSKNRGLAAAAWGLAAEMGSSCEGSSILHGLLTHDDSSIRLEIARGISLTKTVDPAHLGPIRACAYYDENPQVAGLCEKTLVDSMAREVSPRGGLPITFVQGGLQVPWAPAPPPYFPHLILREARPQLVVSGPTGQTFLLPGDQKVSDSGLVY